MKAMEDRAVRMWVLLFVLVLMVGSFAGGVVVSRSSVYGLAAQLAQIMPGLYETEADANIPPATDLRPLATFWEVRDKILRNYVYPIEDPTKLTYGAIQGMLGALEDPWSRFLTPEDFAEFTKETEGSFEGIGAWLEQDRGTGDQPSRVVIMSIIPEGPAAKADVHPRDVVVGVDDKSVEGMNLQQVVDLIRGPAGTPVKLILKREGRQDLIEVEIVRARVDTPTVEAQVLPGQIGYVWLRSFNKLAERDTRAALEKLLAQDIRGLVLDLSLNGGGLLEQAIAVSSLFFKEGPVVYVRERGGEPQAYNALPGAMVPGDLPMVVLIDGGTASASEIVAGALQERDRAKVIGQNSFGKSRVQTVIKLNDDSALVLSTAVYLTPDMHDVGEPWEEDKDKRGLRPDVALDPPDHTQPMRYKDWHEEQIRKATRFLEEQIAQAEGGTRG